MSEEWNARIAWVAATAASVVALAFQQWVAVVVALVWVSYIAFLRVVRQPVQKAQFDAINEKLVRLSNKVGLKL